LKKNSPDIIFINLDLKPNDALIVLKDIKQFNKEPNPYVIIYTENNDDFVQELAFNSGADFFINFHQKYKILL
jgi:PleD family two-component response regulator